MIESLIPSDVKIIVLDGVITLRSAIVITKTMQTTNKSSFHTLPGCTQSLWCPKNNLPEKLEELTIVKNA